MTFLPPTDRQLQPYFMQSGHVRFVTAASISVRHQSRVDGGQMIIKTLFFVESGLARSYVGGIERGQRNLAHINIYILAEALGVTPGEMLNFFPKKKQAR